MDEHYDATHKGEVITSHWLITLGLMSFLKSAQRLLKLAKKPGREELWLSVRICFLGIIVIGVIGFVIKLLAGVFQTRA